MFRADDAVVAEGLQVEVAVPDEVAKREMAWTVAAVLVQAAVSASEETVESRSPLPVSILRCAVQALAVGPGFSKTTAFFCFDTQ